MAKSDKKDPVFNFPAMELQSYRKPKFQILPFQTLKSTLLYANHLNDGNTMRMIFHTIFLTNNIYAKIIG